MSINLIKAELINPMKFPVRRVLTEVAKVLKISEQRIEGISCGKYRLWVNIQGVGGRFISYRRLPIWTEEAIAAIENTSNLEALKQLGDIFQIELQHYQKQYNLESIDTLRSRWSDRRDVLREEEKLIAPIIARQQEGDRWMNGWFEVLTHSFDREFLQFANAEIQRQTRQFQDLPKIIEAVEKMWQKRWQELKIGANAR